MKTQLLLIAALLTPLGINSVYSQEAATSSLGREDYSDRSSQELRQLRAQIDAVAKQTPQPGEARLAPLYDALSDAEDALAAWKTANPLEAPQRRADYEKAHSQVLSLWTDFRTTRATAS